MESFRNMVHGWLGKTLLFLLVVPFAIVGIESYFAGGGRLPVATVDGEKIYQPEMDKLVERQRRELIARMGPNANPAALDVAAIRKSVLENLISSALLAQQAKKTGYLIPDAMLAKQISEVPDFQVNGKFDSKRYEQVLRQNDEDPNTFHALAKKRLASSLLMAGIGQSGLATSAELERLSSLDNQKRDVYVAMVPVARYLADLSVSDEEIKKYYEVHPDRFTTPETVTLDYITVKRDDFLAAATPNAEELQSRYEEKVKAITANEQRQAQHILITVDEKTKDADALKKIKEVEKRARSGEDFGKLAKEFSQDPGSVANGGDLGFAGRGMFAPEFEKALFSLKEGEISGPVKTQYGYHLIKLNKIQKSEAPSFASLKSEIEKEAKSAKAEELFSDAVDKLDAAVYEASDLKEPAEKFQRTVASTEPFTRAGGTGLAGERKIIEVAFSEDLLKEGKSSPGIHLADGRVVWLHVRSHVPAALKSLAEVRADARNQLLLEKAHEKAKSVSASITKALSEGASLAEVAAKEKLSWQYLPDATRRTKVPLPEILQTAYRLPHPAAGKVSADNVSVGSSYVIVAVSKVTEGAAADAKVLSQMRNVLSENRSQQEFQDYLRFLRENSKVVINTKAQKKDEN